LAQKRRKEALCRILRYNRREASQPGETSGGWVDLSAGEQRKTVDPLFWILSGVVAGCLVGIIILWQLEFRAEKRLAAQDEGESSASLPVVDPLAELERIDTRPIPAAVEGTAADEGPALRPSAPRPPAAAPGNTPAASFMPLEEFPTGKLPGMLVSTSALAELPTGKLPGVMKSPQPAAEPRQQTPANTPEPPSAPRLIEPTAGAAGAQEMAFGAPGRARLHLAELARERGYLEHTLEANQIKLEELQRGLVLPDSEEALAISGLQGEITRQRQRLQEIGALEAGYRQAEAAWAGQVSEQAGQANQHAPRAFGARRLSRPRAERTLNEPPGDGSSSQFPPG
jgi:hypothetical protein